MNKCCALDESTFFENKCDKIVAVSKRKLKLCKKHYHMYKNVYDDNICSYNKEDWINLYISISPQLNVKPQIQQLRQVQPTTNLRTQSNLCKAYTQSSEFMERCKNPICSSSINFCNIHSRLYDSQQNFDTIDENKRLIGSLDNSSPSDRKKTLIRLNFMNESIRKTKNTVNKPAGSFRQSSYGTDIINLNVYLIVKELISSLKQIQNPNPTDINYINNSINICKRIIANWRNRSYYNITDIYSLFPEVNMIVKKYRL